MFGLSPKLPVSEQDRLWVDEGFRRLEKLLGRRRMLDARVILPTAEDFPDTYDRDPASAQKLFHRVCGYMQVDPRKVELEIFSDETEELREMLPYWHGKHARCAGLYTQHAMAEHASGKHMMVAVRSTQLQDPLALIATLAHELGHVILLGGGLMDPKTPDHEPMTDLLTVYLGFGIFTSASAARFTQFQNERHIGWSMQRLGYLPEEVFGYALAKFAAERAEEESPWTKHLSTNVVSYYKRSRRWLEKNPHPVITAKPIG